jgi:Protein of unknown function (DUF1702)
MVNLSPRSPESIERLNGIVALALGAHEVALQDDSHALDAHLETVDIDLLGFAIEGSAMGLVVLDQRERREPSRLDEFFNGRWAPFSLLMYAGIGLGLAELGASVLAWAEEHHKLDAGFAIDGYAFHLALGAPDKYLAGSPPPPEFTGAAGRLFDHGLARSTWFTCGADPYAVATAIERFPADRRADIWSGIGLAATYAGGLDADGLAVLRSVSGHPAALAGGSALAGYGRVLAGNVVPGNEAANMALTGLSTTEVSDLVGSCRAAAGTEFSLDAFVRWHDAIRHKFADL